MIMPVRLSPLEGGPSLEKARAVLGHWENQRSNQCRTAITRRMPVLLTPMQEYLFEEHNLVPIHPDREVTPEDLILNRRRFSAEYSMKTVAKNGEPLPASAHRPFASDIDAFYLDVVMRDHTIDTPGICIGARKTDIFIKSVTELDLLNLDEALCYTYFPLNSVTMMPAPDA